MASGQTSTGLSLDETALVQEIQAALAGVSDHPQSTLYAYLVAHPGPPPPAQARRWSRQVAAAVADLHRQGQVHGDLRTDNLLLRASTPDADGLDLYLGPPDAAASSALPPAAGASLDLFTLGSVLYAISTGRWPHGTTATLLLAGHGDKNDDDNTLAVYSARHRFPSDASSLPTGVVILKCWLHQYSTADKVVRDLEALPVTRAAKKTGRAADAPKNNEAMMCRL